MKTFEVLVQLTGTAWVMVEADTMAEAKEQAEEFTDIGEMSSWSAEALEMKEL